jgi:anti-sigma B factor antagonist
MNIIERTLNDVTILDLEGNLTLGGNMEFRQRINTIINSGARKLIVNLAGVQYMDSCGLGELISCYTAMQRVSGHLKLLHLNHRLQQLLVVTKLITLFETFNSESAAVANFTSLS